MATGVYRIEDEPAPGTLARFTVNPFWPLLGLMLGGGWLAWPWFVFNALAIGSATRRREILVIVGGVLALLALTLLTGWLRLTETLPRGAIPYVLYVAFPIIKLAMGYWVYTLQSRSFQLYEHFGGAVKNGMLIVIFGFLARGRIANSLGQELAGFWNAVLG